MTKTVIALCMIMLVFYSKNLASAAEFCNESVILLHGLVRSLRLSFRTSGLFSRVFG